MKKIALSLILASMSSGLFAQLTKGTLSFTGTVAFGGNKSTYTQMPVNNQTAFNNETKTSQMALLPAVGYFVSDRIEAGIGLLISKNTTTTTYVQIPPPQPNNVYTTKQENVNPMNGFALFGNYYLKNEQLYAWYIGAQILSGGGTSQSTTTKSNGSVSITNSKNSGSAFGFNTGFLYFVRNNVALNGSLGLLSFNSTKNEFTGTNGFRSTTKSGGWAFGVNGLIVNIGVKLFIRKGI